VNEELVTEAATGLSLPMVRSLTWWTHDDMGLDAAVPAPTKTALVRRGLAEWVPGDDLCPRLTALGVQVRELLIERDPE
jgi:hypothetical protein